MEMNRYLSRAVLKTHEKITGRKILASLERLNETQWLSRDVLDELQQSKLQRLVEYAYQNVPFYRTLFKQVGISPDDIKRDPKCFFTLPYLTKSIIRENWNDMLTVEQERRKGMSKLATSGSTGQPLVFMQDSDYRDVVTADIQRHMGWAGWRLGDVHAMIWGVNPNRTRKQKLRSQGIDWVWNRFQINAFQMTNQSMEEFASQIRRKKPRILFGYATGIYYFAKFVREHKYSDIIFNGIFTTAEILLPPIREFIKETFQCEIFNRYGTLELGGVACECECHTGLHISIENNFVEILNDGVPVKPGYTGDIVVTNLNNLGMPFIRYKIGDLGTWYEGDECCCGRKSQRLLNIEGRRVDSFQTRDGRRVWSGFAGAGFLCLTNPAIKKFQVVQKTLDLMIVRLAVDQRLVEKIENEIIHSFQNAFGDNVQVKIEYCDDIPTLASGKHQYAVSELNNIDMP